MVRPKRNRIYYVPGLISLTLLPILFIIEAQKEVNNKPIHSLTVRLLDTTAINDLSNEVATPKINFLPNRNFIEINLTGENETNKIKLGFAQLRIGEITFQNDTVNGLHFKFNDSSKYWAYVKAIDILTTEKAKRYLAINDDIWFYHVSTDTTTKKPVYTMLECGTVPFKQKASSSTNMWEEINHIWRTSWKIILAYLGFMIAIYLLSADKVRVHKP